MNLYQKRNFWIYVSIACAILLVHTSCNHSSTNVTTQTATQPKVEQKVSLVQLLLGTKKHLFRSVDLGDDSELVLQSEVKAPDENDSNDIIFTLPIDTARPDSVNESIDSVNYFTINYYFDKRKLNEIDEDIYLKNDSVAANVLARLTDYLTSKYGDYASQNDSRVWSTKHNGKKDWITLSDQSEEYDNGKLLLVLYSEDY